MKTIPRLKAAASIGGSQKAFFFAGGRYLGTDTTQNEWGSGGLKVVAVDISHIAISY